MLKNSSVGDAFNNIGRQLKDGHWVLAFPSVEAANYATLLVDQHAAKLRAYYCEVWRRASFTQDAIVGSPGYCILCSLTRQLTDQHAAKLRACHCEVCCVSWNL